MKILSLICLATLFISCQTTKVYETQKLTKNGVEIYYSNSYMEDDDIISQEERGNYKDVIIDHSHGISTFASVVYEKKGEAMLSNKEIVTKLTSMKKQNGLLRVFYRKTKAAVSCDAYVPLKDAVKTLESKSQDELYTEMRQQDKYYAVNVLTVTKYPTLVLDTLGGIIKDEYESITGERTV